MRWPKRVLSWVRARLATFDSPPEPIDRLIMRMSGLYGTVVSRAEALSVAAVQKGRNMICSVATLPLVQRGPDRRTVDNPLFVQLDPDVANVVTLSQTLEDLLFDAVSWWQVTGFGWDGFPAKIRHLAVGTVSLDPPSDGRTPSPLPSGLDPREAVVWVDGKPVPSSEVIRFDSPNPAVLVVGARAIRRALLLDKAASMYADDPRPLDYFTPAEGADPASDDDIRQILTDWKSARKERGTGYVPAALKYATVATPSPAELQLVELQRQASLDIANALGVDPEDLGVSTTSRTYANAVDRRLDRINEVLKPYMRAITDRLSMNDVTRRGYYVTFDLDDYMKSNPTERWAVYKIASELGVLDVDEIREKEGMPAGAPEPEPEPDPDPTAAEPALAASRGRLVTFDTTGVTFADLPLETFAVDVASRTITGMALPYNTYGSKFGLKFRFEKGALVWADDVSRVKLLIRHDQGQPIGYATKLQNTATGLQVTFKVGRGEAGDTALAMAEDKILDGLSAGVEWDMAVDAVPDPKDRSALLVRKELACIALTVGRSTRRAWRA